MALLEQRLQSFLEEHQVDAETMFSIVRRMHAVDPTSLMCLDILVTDYEDFIQMMIDYQYIMSYQLGD